MLTTKTKQILDVFTTIGDVVSLLYTVAHETSAKLRVVIHWLILTEKCYINIGWNLNRYVVMMDEEWGKSNVRMKWNYFN
jgi:hypothetical protein